MEKRVPVPKASACSQEACKQHEEHTLELPDKHACRDDIFWMTCPHDPYQQQNIKYG